MYFERNFKILTYGPQMTGVLSRPIEENECEDIPRLFDYMLTVMRKADGVGLAAPQIGCFRQFVLVERRGSVIGLVNPEITRLYGKEVEEEESCLSLPPAGNECMVPRLEIVDVEASLAQTPKVRRKFTFRGSIARIVQHELDHLTGTFFIDRVSDRRKSEVMERFNHWKSVRRAQIRKTEENHNGIARIVAVGSAQPRLS